MAGIPEIWEGFSLAQKVCSCITAVLAVGAFLYVPYHVPTTDSYEYSWIWKPVKYEDPLTKNLLDQIDSAESETELHKTRIAMDPEWRKNSIERTAHYSRRRAKRNVAMIVVLGIVAHLGVGAVEQLKAYRSHDR